MKHSRIPRVAFLTLAGACLLAAACSSIQDFRPGRDARSQNAKIPARTVQIVTEAPDVQALNVESIPAGNCGMLLWTLEAGNPVMVFRAVRGEGAEMSIDGAPARLDLVRQSGESRYGFASNQEYISAGASESAVIANVQPSFGMPFDGGVYIEQGLITLVNEEGWERVLPVAGLAGCRS